MTTDGKHHDEQPPAGFNPLRDIVVAITFLTRLPLPMMGSGGTSLASAAWAFPLAGVISGGVGGGVFFCFGLLDVPLLIAVTLGLAATVLITGGLHEDGLADVTDGFGGGATKEKKLEIMHDSRIGAYGVLALIFSVGLRVAALLIIANHDGAHGIYAAFIAAAVFSRGLLPAVMLGLPHAREDGVSRGAGRPGIPGVAVSLGLGAFGVYGLYLTQPTPAGYAMASALVAVLVFCLVARRQVGGQTGDVIGAAQQVAEVSFLITLATL